MALPPNRVLWLCHQTGFWGFATKQGFGALPQNPLKVLFREITSAQVPSRTLRIPQKLIRRGILGMLPHRMWEAHLWGNSVPSVRRGGVSPPAHRGFISHKSAGWETTPLQITFCKTVFIIISLRILLKLNSRKILDKIPIGLSIITNFLKKFQKPLDKTDILCYNREVVERWLSWSKAHDWKSCKR